MGAVSGCFGLGVFSGFLVFNTAGAWLMGVFDRGIGFSAAIHFSIVLVVVLSGMAAWFFCIGLAGRRVSEWRAVLVGLIVSAGYWALVAIASALLGSAPIPFAGALAAIPFLAICVFAPRLILSRQ